MRNAGQSPLGRVVTFLVTFITLAAAMVTIWLAGPAICSSLGAYCPFHPPASGQRVGVISYFDPSPPWGQVDQGAPTVGLAVVNPNNGPGASADPDYAAQVKRNQQAGVATLGYVDTSYAAEQDTTRTLAAVEREINDYYAWYPGMGGVFVDEVTADCANVGAYYLPLYRFIKAKDHSAVVVLDPGQDTAECYMSASDIIIEFEGSYTDYTNWQPSTPNWETRYPHSRFWHIITGASQSEMTKAVTMARYWGAGWVYITDGSASNGGDPFQALPTYWSAEVAAVAKA